MDIDNDRLASFFDRAFTHNECPTSWLTSLIVAVPKPGKDATDPNNYRAIALESCILKFASLLLHLKLSQALEEAKVLPASQNGFRAGYRTNNNAFILRTLIEKAKSQDDTLYVAFVDISNAFPSTNQSSLWNKLADYNLTGKYFDWLRSLYNQMTYVIAHNGDISDRFRAMCGVLMGDPSSPTLWNIFLSTFNLIHDPNDLDLLGIVISHLEHADDIALISRSSHGLQSHLKAFETYCHTNNLSISAGKSWVMVFGRLPSPLPTLYLAGEVLSYRDSVRYVGLHLQSTHRHLFAAHYTVKRDSAITAAGSIAGCDLIIGHRRLDPLIAKQLYSALIDCHLINGCEIAIDTDKHLLSMLEQVQLLFLRWMLGLSRRSMVAPLFTETGIMPIRIRRVILALRYLIYLLKLPPDHYAYLALQENNNLRTQGRKCWLSDLDWAITHLPSSTLSLPPLA
ncbi:hypothetical protein LENED_005478 [Lentinula edodes]|uniref:Reverse transcriptase domain-containing protein n=1 Tax=Lentinula edodes TaxID=5353 RepID=A0A1Q3E9I7_LENED|nr:hypothetical protein LENED_005478 [Lentinula edodes]